MGGGQGLGPLHLVLGLHRHHPHPLGVPGGFRGEGGGVEHHAPPVAGAHRHLLILGQQAGGHQGEPVAVGPGELAPPGLGPVGGQLHPGGLAVAEEKQQVGGVVPRGAGPDEFFLRLHSQPGGEVVPQQAGLGVVEVGQAGFVALLLVGEHQQLVPVGPLPLEAGAVPLLVLLLPAHAQGLGGDLLEVPLPGDEHVHRVGGYVRPGGGLDLRRLPVLVEDLGAPGGGVLLFDVLQLLGDDPLDPVWGADDLLQIRDLVLQGGGLLCPLQDIFLVDVPQADIRHILRLDLVDAEADDQVGHHLGLLLRLPDDADGLVDVQQDALEALEQVELLLLLLADVPGAAAHPVHPPRRPLLQNLPHPHHPGHPGDEDIEVAGKGVLQGGGLEQPGHEHRRVGPPLQVDGQLQAVEIRLVPHIGDLLDPARLHQLRHLVQDGLHSGGVGDLIDLDDVVRLDVPPLGPQAHRAPARAVDLRQRGPVIQQLAPGGEVGGLQNAQQVHAGVPQVGDGGVAHLA